MKTVFDQNKFLSAMVEAFVPDKLAQIQQVLGVPVTGAGPGKDIYFSEAELEWYPKEMFTLAREAVPVWTQDRFRIKKWMKAARESVRKLREAHPETALAFLLRKGIQSIANDWYTVTGRDWQGYMSSYQSDNYAEWHNPLYGSVLPTRVGRGDRFPEGRVIGEDSVVTNYKFGMVESFDRELFDDDQTGQIKKRSAHLGAAMAILENVWAALRFIGVANSYANIAIPASRYTTQKTDGSTVTGPWSKTMHGAYGNRQATYTALTLTALKSGWSDLLNAKDPLGNKIMVAANVLLHSNMDALHAPMLVKPPAGVPYYPAPIGAGTQTASTAASGFPGGVFGANPFMGLGIEPVRAYYLPDWAWAIGEKGRGILFQERDPLEVIQEAAASGAAFEVDAIRYRSRRRFEVEWVGGGSRFWWLGNPGSGLTVDGDAGATGSF